MEAAPCAMCSVCSCYPSGERADRYMRAGKRAGSIDSSLRAEILLVLFVFVCLAAFTTANLLPNPNSCPSVKRSAPPFAPRTFRRSHNSSPSRSSKVRINAAAARRRGDQSCDVTHPVFLHMCVCVCVCVCVRARAHVCRTSVAACATESCGVRSPSSAIGPILPAAVAGRTGRECGWPLPRSCRRRHCRRALLIVLVLVLVLLILIILRLCCCVCSLPACLRRCFCAFGLCFGSCSCSCGCAFCCRGVQGVSGRHRATLRDHHDTQQAGANSVSLAAIG